MKYALLTGATGGLGQAFAALLIREGYRLVATGRNPKQLKALDEAYGEKILTRALDLTDENAIGQFLDYLRLESIFPELVVNNAGFGWHGSYENAEAGLYGDMNRVNIRALSLLTAYFYHGFKEKGSGGLINVASVAGLLPGGPLMAGYYATKAYVRALTLGIAAENKNPAIRILCLCPGPTWSNFVGMQGPRKFPRTLYMTTPEAVVARCYKDFLRGKKLSAPGAFTKAAIFLNRFVPMGLSLWLTEKFQAKLK